MQLTQAWLGTMKRAGSIARKTWSMPADAPYRFQILGAAVLFSTGGVAIKATTLSGLEVACARSAVAAFALWLLLPSWRCFWRPNALMVGACYASTLVCFVVATKYTMAANAIFLQSTAPIYVLLLAPRLLGEENRRSDYVVTLLLMLGLGLFFVGVDSATDTAPDPTFGNLVAIAAGLSLALGLIGLRRLAREGSVDGEDASGGAVLAGNVMAALVCLPFVFPLSPVQTSDVLLIGYLGAIQIGLGYWILTRGIRGVPAVEVSLLLLAEPVLNGVWAWLVLGEQPGSWSLMGCVVILFATCFRVAMQRREVEPESQQ
jgi:DME family drug/metabolite transporter